MTEYRVKVSSRHMLSFNQHTHCVGWTQLSRVGCAIMARYVSRYILGIFMNKSVFLAMLFVAVLTGCKATGEPRVTYAQPSPNTPSATFIGEESPQKLFVKGHEYIYICKVGEGHQSKDSFNNETRIALGKSSFSICYLEGGNFSEIPFKMELIKETTYQLKLGEHQYTKVNFYVIDTQTGETVIGPMTVPKDSLFEPVILY